MVEHVQAPLDRTYGALAHNVRREMLQRLRAGQTRVTDLAEPFELSLAAASKHIRVLESAGLIHRDVLGRVHQLSLDPRPLAEAGEWIDAYRGFWIQRLDWLEGYLRGGQR